MRYFVLALGIVICLTSVAVAQTAILDAKRDAYVDSEIPDVNVGNEEIITVFADWEDEMVGPSAGLIWFDMNDLPPDAHVIVEAMLILHLVGTENDVDTLEVFRAGDDWSEMDVTWDTRPTENRDRSVLAQPPPMGVFEVDVTLIMQSWVYGEFPNHGFYIDVPDRGSWVDIDFASREHQGTGFVPRLYVEYFYDDIAEKQVESAVEFHLSALSPGPVQINLNLPMTISASLKVYDACGALVGTLVDGSTESGTRQLTWRTERSGVYFVKLEAGDVRLIRKAIVLN